MKNTPTHRSPFKKTFLVVDFNVTDFFYGPSEKGFHSGVYLGRKGLGQGSEVYPGASGRNWAGEKRGIWKGSTELLGRGRLQVAPREGEMCLGPVVSKGEVRPLYGISTM